MMRLITITGSCHCGNIRYTLKWPETETEIPVRECGCSFCKKHGGAWTSHRQAELSAIIADTALVSKYRFGTATADFCVCSRCGVAPFVISHIEGRLYAVINTNSFDETGSLPFSRASTDFDGEQAGDRLERRKRNWIPNVQISAPPG